MGETAATGVTILILAVCARSAPIPELDGANNGVAANWASTVASASGQCRRDSPSPAAPVSERPDYIQVAANGAITDVAVDTDGARMSPSKPTPEARTPSRPARYVLRVSALSAGLLCLGLAMHASADERPSTASPETKRPRADHGQRLLGRLLDELARGQSPDPHSDQTSGPQARGGPLSWLRLCERVTPTPATTVGPRIGESNDPDVGGQNDQIETDPFELLQRPSQLPAPDGAAADIDTLCADAPPNGEVPSPWWERDLGRPQRTSEPALYVNLDMLVADALKYSPRVRAYSDLPLVREARVVEALSEFDIRTFIESVFTRTSNPVGNVLETGGPPRLRDSDWTQNAGLRKKTYRGGALELSQRIGHQASNSVFFDPPVQGNARLVLSFTQPLLRGRGIPYNTSRIVLAQIDTRIAWDQLCANVQDHLGQVSQAYWQLHLERAKLLQQQRLYEQARVVMDDLEGRRSIDSLRSQIVRARAAVAARRSDLARAGRSIRNAEARLRALVDAPDLRTHRSSELVPLDLPVQNQQTIDLQDASATALDLRPEINEAVKQVRAAATRLHVAENELMPHLNLVLQTYVAGIAGEGDIAQAFADQFGEGEPTYSAGLQLELPLGRREARAARELRQIELRQLTSQLESTVVDVLSEVEIATGEVETTYQELRGKYDAMMAAGEEVDYLTERWHTLPGEERAASFVLEELLDAQERAAFEQYGFAQAQVAHTLSLVELRRATGTLLQHEGVIFQRFYDGCLPSLALHKATRVAEADPIPGGQQVVPSAGWRDRIDPRETKTR